MLGLNEYIVLDLETTGLSKRRHRITEIAAVKVKGNKIVDEFQTLVNPRCPIPGFITKLTGITDDMVINAPTIDKILPSFLDFIGQSPLVAHNATFDYGFISHNAENHLNFSLENQKLCTRKLANRLLPDLPSKKLSNLCEHFNIQNIQAHRAMADVKATSKLFSKFVSMMRKNDIKSKDELFKFESSPIKRFRAP